MVMEAMAITLASGRLLLNLVTMEAMEGMVMDWVMVAMDWDMVMDTIMERDQLKLYLKQNPLPQLRQYLKPSPLPPQSLATAIMVDTEVMGAMDMEVMAGMDLAMAMATILERDQLKLHPKLNPLLPQNLAMGITVVTEVMGAMDMEVMVDMDLATAMATILERDQLKLYLKPNPLPPQNLATAITVDTEVMEAMDMEVMVGMDLATAMATILERDQLKQSL